MIVIPLIFYLGMIISDYYLMEDNRKLRHAHFGFLLREFMRYSIPVILLSSLFGVLTWNVCLLAVSLSVLYPVVNYILCKLEKHKDSQFTLKVTILRYKSFIFIIDHVLKISLILIAYSYIDPFSASNFLARCMDFLFVHKAIFDPSVKLLLIAIILLIMVRVCSHLVAIIIADLGHSYGDQTLQETAATAENHPLIDKFMNMGHRAHDYEMEESLEFREQDSQNDQFNIIRKVSKQHYNFVADPRSVGKYIGIIERVLIVFFVVNSAYTAIAFIGAVKTLARFKQFEDKRFAEYYLLGTLLSVLFGFMGGFLLSRVLG